MRHHQDPALEAAADEALSDPRTARTSYELRIGGVPVAPREIRYAAEDVREQDAPAMRLELTLPGFWPDSLEGQTAEVDVTVAGADYPEFRGTVFWVEPQEDGDTTVEAYTESTWLAEQENGREVVWSGIAPRRAMHEAVSGLRYPGLDLDAVPTTPELYRESPRLFEADAKRSERLQVLRDEARVAFFDGPDGTGTGATLAGLSVPGDPVRSYVVGRDVRPGAFRPTPKFKGRFFAVVVRAEDPEGGVQTLRRIPVDNRGVYVPEHVVYPVEATDATPLGIARALDTGLSVARALTYGAWEAEAELLVFDPRIVRGDTLLFEETREEGDVDVTRRWLLVVAGYSRDPKSGVSAVSGACLKVHESSTDARPGEVFARSVGVVSGA